MNKEPWCQFQEAIAEWTNKTTPRIEKTPAQAFNRSFEEVVELSEAIDDGNPKEIAFEATDVIIRMLGIIAIVGGNAAELLEKKIETMQRKYPADIIRRQLTDGMPYERIMQQHKEAWNGNGARIIPLFKA